MLLRGMMSEHAAATDEALTDSKAGTDNSLFSA